jgi:hypothetical protein
MTPRMTATANQWGLGAAVDPRVRVLRWQRGQNEITVGLFNGRVTSIKGKFDHLPP